MTLRVRRRLGQYRDVHEALRQRRLQEEVHLTDQDLAVLIVLSVIIALLWEFAFMLYQP